MLFYNPFYSGAEMVGMNSYLMDTEPYNLAYLFLTNMQLLRQLDTKKIIMVI